ncbi:uncharacterized protein [Battus philenor]|uniref:uncharacterized protein n=1 Tax=Battus philenor TaxID=42288 RepID=UPI0035CF9269
MLAPNRDASGDNSEEDFNESVESLMKCEDFKSNFARRLSNRYISWSAIPGQSQDVFKLRSKNCTDVKNHVPKSIEPCTQLLKSDNMEQISEPAKPPDKQFKPNVDIRKTEMNVLKMEVETLRWQLAQTEANRQMHIALLKQIVTCLNRVKTHFEGQNNEDLLRKNVPSLVLARSLNFNDLPRSRSVLHVNKNLDYAINPTKKISTRKISKSISNVNGYKDHNGLWSQSKLSLVPEHETSQKINEELSRLITLANTVLCTKLPDLACACQGKNNITNYKTSENNKAKFTTANSANNINFMADDSVVENKTTNAITNKVDEVNSVDSGERHTSNSPNSSELENEFSDIKTFAKEHGDIKSEIRLPDNEKVTHVIDKLNEFNSVSNFIEDESGFSSMSSFQEIGIPIISIIPPSPCKEVEYLEDIPDIIEEPEKWKPDVVNKQSVKVFWV